MNDNLTENGMTVLENKKSTTNFTKKSKKGNAPDPQEILAMKKEITKKEEGEQS